MDPLNEAIIAAEMLEELDMTASHYLPMESEAPDFVFADATAHNVAMKVKGFGKLWASLQWRHDGFHFAGSTSDGPFFPSPSYSGLTRIHCIEEEGLERIANVATYS